MKSFRIKLWDINDDFVSVCLSSVFWSRVLPGMSPVIMALLLLLISSAEPGSLFSINYSVPLPADGGHLQTSRYRVMRPNSVTSSYCWSSYSWYFIFKGILWLNWSWKQTHQHWVQLFHYTLVKSHKYTNSAEGNGNGIKTDTGYYMKKIHHHHHHYILTQQK